jgi:hypothetical protein
MPESSRLTHRGGRTEGPPALTYRCVELPSGERLPVEERLGRRLLRRIPAECDEARALFAEERVTLVRSPLGSGRPGAESETDH